MTNKPFRSKTYGYQPDVADKVSNQILQKVDQSDLSESSRKIKIVACVLRNDGSGWRFIGTENGDANHSHINAKNVTADTSTITLNFAFNAKNVLSFVACPDETFAQLGYNIGASVGTNYAAITVAQQSGMSTGGYISYIGSAWDFTYASGITGTFSAGVLTLTHPNIGGYSVNATGRGGVYKVNIGSCTNTTTQIMFYDNSGNLVTTPDANMKFFFSKTSGTGGAVNPQTIVSSLGNIWCLGVFEV